MVEVDGGQIWGSLRLGWMDGVNVAFDSEDDLGGYVTVRKRQEGVESPGAYENDCI